MNATFNEPSNRFIGSPAPEAGDLYKKGRATGEKDIITKSRDFQAETAQSSRVDLVVLFPRGKRNSCKLTVHSGISKLRKYDIIKA